MMVSRNGRFGVWTGVAVGTVLLAPIHGSAQQLQSASCEDLDVTSPLGDALPCAQRGQAVAQHILGVWYETGDYGLTENAEEAVRWYRLAAEQGLADAQHNLASMYAGGEGVPRDREVAVGWFLLAADQGHAPSQYRIGLMFAEGQGLPEDDEEAVLWYNLAAEQGFAPAQYRLGIMYKEGAGVQENIFLSYMWYNLSAAQGNSRARWDKIVIEQTMSREEIDEAQRLTREWMETHPADVSN